MGLSRRFAVVLLLAVSVTTAGCLGLVLGTESLAFAANDATVAPDALERAGYHEYRDVSINRTQSFSVAGQNRTAAISNELHAYNRTGTLGSGMETEVGRLVVFSTPAVTIAGRTFNPLGSLSNRDIARRSLPSGGEGLTPAGNRTVRALGDRRNVSTFATASQRGDRRVSTVVHVTVFRHGSDFVVSVAVHPEQVGGEQARIDGMLRSLRHRTDG